MRPMVKGGFPMLSSAALNALMWVISRVIRNCKRVLGAGVPAEVDQTLVDDLCAGLGGDIAAKVDVEFAGDLEVVRGPGVAHRVVQVDAAAARNRDQGIGFGFLTDRFHRLQMHARERADDLKWLSSSVPMSISRSFRAASSQLRPWTEYCIAAASSPLAPPNCSSSMLPKRGSGSSTRTVYMSFFT